MNRKTMWCDHKVSHLSLLAFSPLLVVTTQAAIGLAIGGLLLIVLFTSAVCSLLLRYVLCVKWRLLGILVMLGILVCILQRLIAMYFYPLSEVLAFSLPLIAINSFCFTQIETRYFQQPRFFCLWHAMIVGLWLSIFLTMVGGLREFLVQGTVLAAFDTLFAFPHSIAWSPLGHFSGLSVISTPAGALFILSAWMAATRVMRRWLALR